MVTATLTAAAVKAQIATQRQRVEALEASLGTMVNGMDKHMVQVGQLCMDTQPCLCKDTGYTT